MKPSVAVVALLVSLTLATNILYVSEHTIPPDFNDWLTSKGHFVTTDFSWNILNAYIPTAFNILIYQSDGGGAWNDNYQFYIEDYVSNGGVYLHVGRDSLSYAQSSLMATLGLVARQDLNGNGVNAYNLPIQSYVECYPLVNGFRKDLRGITPSITYPNWVNSHLNDVTAAQSSYYSCLPNSQYGEPWSMWSLRPIGSGAAVWMTTSTYVLEEFWKLGFYQAAFMNLLGYASTGIIFGDPHVVTLDRLKFDMPDESANNYFNFYTSNSVSVNGHVEYLPHIASGLWLTEVGLRFTVSGVEHRLYCYTDIPTLTFQFILDDQELTNATSTEFWEYILDNDVMVGSWHNANEFSSPGLFKLFNSDEGSKVIVQAVEWNRAPSFSIEVHQPDGLAQTNRDLNGGILQIPASQTEEARDVSTPDVFRYLRSSLFD